MPYVNQNMGAVGMPTGSMIGSYGVPVNYPSMPMQQPMINSPIGSIQNPSMMPPMQQPQVPQGVNPLMAGRPKIDPRQFETPEITMGEGTKKGGLFTISDDKGSNVIAVDNASDMEVLERKEKKSGKTKKASNDNPQAPIVRAQAEQPLTGTVDDHTIYTYAQTNNLLHDTLNQIDSVNLELVKEFDNVKTNRTMKNKYNVLIGLSQNIGAMIGNRISVIKELNTSITKSNDMDYKKYKDIKAAEATMNDDKYITDLYQAFIQNPQNMAPQYQYPQMNLDPSVVGSGIVRANLPSSLPEGNTGMVDASYLNYMTNLTPEQNLMRYEGNPDVKQVVVYDAASGNRQFQMMNVRTGEVIPNVPVYDEMFLADTTLDLKAGVAKNLNLNETFPIVVINDNIASQY